MIARSAFLNLVGHAVPLAAALAFVPALVSRLQPEQFGFLALAWALVGYFSLFDLGLGRALSRLVAERAGTSRDSELPELSRSALSLTLGLGAAAGLALYAAASALCERLLNLPLEMQADATVALRLLAASLPLVTVTAALRGLLEAGHRFGWVNAIRVPLGVLTFAAPLAATLWSTSLVALVTALAFVRVVVLVAHWMVCTRLYPALAGLGWPRPSAVGELLGYGGWLTVSNVVGPLMVYADRLAIAGVLAVSWVAYYSAAYEIVTRLWLIPAALCGVLFPVMAAASRDRLENLYRSGVKAVLIAVFPIALPAMLYAPEWLQIWLGDEYAIQGARVAQLLCLGTALNCLAYIPFTLLQARGRADLPAKCHLLELPLYLVVLALALQIAGIEGAAAAWALRAAADAAALFAVAARVQMQPRFTAGQVIVIVLALAMLVMAMIPSLPAEKIIYLVATLALFGALGWLILLEEGERARVRNPRALILGDPRR
jgi:O-antigen/teichoic acid export membrane protein